MSAEGEAEPQRTVYGDGITFVQWSLLWLLGGVAALVSIGFDLVVHDSGKLFGRDFTNLWVAGRLVVEQRAGCAFDVSCFRDAMLGELHILTVQNYSYPPSALFMAVPFGLLPYYAALALWTICGALFFIWTARPFLPKGFAPYLAVLTPAATINIWNGHYGFILGGLWLLFFRNLDPHPRRAGVFAALLTFKPHLGLMVAASSLRRRTTLVSGIIATIAIVLLSGEAFGWDTWGAFLTDTTAAQLHLLERGASVFYFRLMPSAYVAFGRGTGGLVAQLLFAGAAVALLTRYRRWDAFSAATATFVIVPYCFNYDMTVACLGFAILLFDRWSSLGWPQRASLVLAFFAPELSYFAGPVVPVALLCALQVQLSAGAVRVPDAGLEDRPPSDARQASGPIALAG